jgi:hypothetical protein
MMKKIEENDEAIGYRLSSFLELLELSHVTLYASA